MVPIGRKVQTTLNTFINLLPACFRSSSRQMVLNARQFDGSIFWKSTSALLPLTFRAARTPKDESARLACDVRLSSPDLAARLPMIGIFFDAFELGREVGNLVSDFKRLIFGTAFILILIVTSCQAIRGSDDRRVA